MKINKHILISALILVAVLTRLMPHPVNFGPMAAIALFAGSRMGSRWMAAMAVILAATVSDLLVNALIYDYFSLSYFVQGGTLAIYACYLLFMYMGSGIKQVSIPAVGGRALLSSVIFFAATNLMVWLGSGMYSNDLPGLLQCYTMALPFFQNTIAGDLLYSAALFGTLAYVEKQQPVWLKA
ncbi:MAG: DUF6580 family putative transport protein [Bacteroidia bacterium]